MPEALIFFLFLSLIASGLIWHFSRSRQILERWAADQNFEILERDYRHFFKGPFFWRSNKGHTVYHVRVRNDQGQVRSGFVRCGSWFFGLFSNVTDVRWEGEWEP